MDEPFSALDAITRDDMNIVLLELWERYRKTVLFVTHSIREAVLLSDRVLVMGRSPSKIIAEIKVPFARPRDFAIGESSQFNELCAGLRRSDRHRAPGRSRATEALIMVEDRAPAITCRPRPRACRPCGRRLWSSASGRVVLPDQRPLSVSARWQAIAVYGHISPTILPPPTMVLEQLTGIFR